MPLPLQLPLLPLPLPLLAGGPRDQARYCPCFTV